MKTPNQIAPTTPNHKDSRGNTINPHYSSSEYHLSSPNFEEKVKKIALRNQ